MTAQQWLAIAMVATPLLLAALVGIAPTRLIPPLAMIAAGLGGAWGLTLSAVLIARARHPWANHWVVLDARAAVMVAVIAVIGAGSLLVSPAYLATVSASVVRPERRPRAYYGGLLVFWATTLAVPLAGNLAAAWLLVEATTATSALLVGFSGRRRALEAGWKYLILTSLGLGVALLGIGFLAAGVPGRGLSGLTWQALGSYSGSHRDAVIAYVIVLIGLAAKIGWAPVHNWLPDAHSEAPPPVSGMLSAALLPTVLVIAWRVEQAMRPVVGASAAQRVLIIFGVSSLAVAVPFLWQSLPWKRLLAYSSLEHMGVIALGIGFASPLAIAGVVIHITGHAVAKALGFYTTTPLLAHEPRAAGHLATGIARTAPPLGAAMGISLGSLAGLPPSPLFASEVLILAGGYQAGHDEAATVTAVLLALGFLGLTHSLLETLAGKARGHRIALPRRAPGVVGLATIAAGLLLGLTATAFALPHSALVNALL